VGSGSEVGGGGAGGGGEALVIEGGLRPRYFPRYHPLDSTAALGDGSETEDEEADSLFVFSLLGRPS
jgi:hypothetical protein